ncbi:TonB dependent receptor [compost metagenome]
MQKAELREISAYHMADLTLNKTINKYLTINAGARNLFDVTRLRTKGPAAGAHTAAASNPFGFGRSYFLGLTMHWSKNNNN